MQLGASEAIFDTTYFLAITGILNVLFGTNLLHVPVENRIEDFRSLVLANCQGIQLNIAIHYP